MNETTGIPGNEEEHSHDPQVLQQLIETMESILEVFPEDASALESLAAAYQQAGDNEKSADAGIRLARLISAEGDWERAYRTTHHVLELVPGHPEAEKERQACLEALRLLGIDPMQIPEFPAEEAEEAAVRERRDELLDLDLSGEIELGWFLLQRSVITQAQYEAAVAGLTENRMTPSSTECLSLLADISEMDNVNLERVLGALSDQTNTPYVDLTRFEFTPQAASLIPLEKARRIGVLPFDRIRNEVMVVILNPVDEALRTAVSEYLGCRTHFFLSSPEQFQAGLLEAMAAQI